MRPDLRDYLEIRTAAPSNFSPDGSKVLVHSNLSGTFQLYRVPRAGGDLQAITDFDQPVSGAYLPTRDEILVSMDEDGNERHQLYLIGDDGTGLRPLVHEPGTIHRLGGISRDGSMAAFASNARNGVDFDVFVVPLQGETAGAARSVLELGGWCHPAGFSPDGSWLGVLRLTDRNGDNDLYLVDLASGEVVLASPHDDEASFSGPAWLADSSGFFFSTDTDRDRSAIARYDLTTRTWRRVIEPGWDAVCSTDWECTRLLVATNEDGYTNASVLDPRTLQTMAEVALPSRGVAQFTFAQDGRHLASFFTSAREAGAAWLHDLRSGSRHRLTPRAQPVPPETMVEPELRRFQSFDGEVVPVFVYLPRQPAVVPIPVIVTIHGGPEGQYRPVFDPLVQYFTARGYAVAAPNVRGSTGYGKRYHHLDDVTKRLDAVADLASLHDWLAADGRFDARRMVLWGASYGGYMVLAGLAFQPERWAAGVDIVGISSLVTFLENTSPWRRAFREREYGSLDRDGELLAEASPLSHVDRVRAPLFLIHGANDPRVPVGEARQVHARLAENEVPTELLVYDDEGHGLARLENRLDAYAKAVDFLDSVLALP